MYFGLGAASSDPLYILDIGLVDLDLSKDPTLLVFFEHLTVILHVEHSDSDIRGLIQGGYPAGFFCLELLTGSDGIGIIPRNGEAVEITHSGVALLIKSGLILCLELLTGSNCIGAVSRDGEEVLYLTRVKPHPLLSMATEPSPMIGH